MLRNDFILHDIVGNEVSVAIENMKFRPSAYGIILHENNILLCNTRSTGKLSIPGGGLNLGESITEGLQREVFEECGIEIEVLNLVDLSEHFFYDRVGKEAWHVHGFFYECRPRSIDVKTQDPKEDEAELPRWIPIKSLHADQFQFGGMIVMNYLHKKFQD